MQVSSNTSTESLAIGQTKKVDSFTLSNSKEFFEILSKNLYSYPVIATIRETMCNAWDAHIKADKTDIPIKAYLEGTDLVVEDFGTGIPHDQIQPIYGVFGASTKIYDKTQTGGFGLGCKAPFAITSSFTVQNIHGGIKSIYSCIRSDPNNNDLPTIRTILSVPTTEPEGVKVTIPCSEILENTNIYTIDNLIGKIARLGNMKVEGIDGRYEKDKFFFIIKDSDIVTSSTTNYYVRYGNVVYPIDRTYMHKGFHTFHNVVFEAEPDTLTIAPSREQLIYDERTKATLDKFFGRLRDYIFRNYKKIFKEVADKTKDTKYAYSIVSLVKTDSWNRYISQCNLQRITWDDERDKVAFEIINDNYTEYCDLRLKLSSLYSYFPRNICKAAYYMAAHNYHKGKINYYLYKVFKEDFKKVFYLDGEHAPKSFFKEISKNTQGLQEYIFNKIFITNSTKSFNKLTSTDRGYVLSVTKKDKDSKIEYYSKLGFKVEYVENDTKAYVGTFKSKIENRCIYDSYHSYTEGRLKNENITCFVDKYENILKSMLGRYSADLFSKSYHYGRATKEPFKAIFCVKIKSETDRRKLIKLGALPFEEYMKVYYKNNVDNKLKQNFEDTYNFIVSKYPTFETNIKRCFKRYIKYEYFIHNVFKLKDILKEKKECLLSARELNDYILAVLEDKGYTDKEKLLFYIWLNEKITILIKENNLTDPETRRLIKKLYLSPLWDKDINDLEFLSEYPEPVRESIFALLLKRKEDAN